MHIKGKFGLKELRDIGLSFVAAFIVAFFVLGIFTLLSMISWVLCWLLVALILTPIGFWLIRWLRDEIIITIDEDDNEKTIKCPSIKF